MVGEDDCERILTRITALVTENWNSSGKPLLLSKLGGVLRREFPQSDWLRQTGLKTILENEGSGVQLVHHPTISEKVGAVPAEAEIPEDKSELFAQHRWGLAEAEVSPPFKADGPTTGQLRHPIFFRNFWRAFHTPTDGRRFVIPPPPGGGQARILEGDSGPPEGEVAAYEILPSDVVSLPAATPLYEKTRATLTNIKKWLARYGLSEEIFVDQAFQPHRIVKGQVTDEFPAVARALADLTPSEQARIFIPLDIVARILRR